MANYIDRQAAIDAFNTNIDELVVSGKENADAVERYLNRVIDEIKQLPPIQPEQTNCDYCHEDVDGYVKPIEKNNHAFVRFGMNGWELDLKANGWHGSAKIMYCPMCGRGLKHG